MLTSCNNGKINMWLKRADKWLPAAFFCCVLGLYLTMLVNGDFVDEMDVFYGGYNLVKSGDLYKVYPTQHMPFSYYLAAPGALLGARTVAQFRLWFYVLMSGLWTGIYIRYRRHLPRLGLLSLPVIYVVQLRMHSLATTMISDHWQGIGLLIVLLELLVYAERKKITVGAACMISLGIVLSFGTTFLSAYALFAVFLGVLVMQAVMAVRGERKVSELLKEDGRLALICLCPFLVLLGWYAVSGNLANAFGGAYELNVTVYSKYIGGFGTSPGGTFTSVFTRWFWYQYKGYTYLTTGDVLWTAQIWFQTAALLVLAVSLWLEKKRIAAVTFVLAVLMSGVRAFDGFHGAPYMAVTCVPMAFCFDGGLSFFLEKKSWKRALPAAAALACALVLVVPQAAMVKNLTLVPWLLKSRQYPETNRYVLEILAEPGERIHTDDISYSATTIMRNNLRLEEGSLGASCPWFYEYYGEREMQLIEEDKPRIVLYEPDGELWGFKVRDYAPELTAYIEEHYTTMGENIYIRNEDFAAAMESLRQAGYGTKLVAPDYYSGYGLGPMLETGRVYEQRFTAEEKRLTAVEFRVATYLGQNRAGIVTQLVDAETGEVLAESTLGKEEIRDNYYSRFAMQVDTEPGKEYIVRAVLDGEVPEGKESRMNFYVSPEKEEANGWLDNERQAFDWALGVEYDPGT